MGREITLFFDLVMPETLHLTDISRHSSRSRGGDERPHTHAHTSLPT